MTNAVEHLLFGEQASSLTCQASFFIKQFCPPSMQLLPIAISYTDQEAIHFTNKYILVPASLNETLALALTERQMAQLEVIQEQALIAIFLTTMGIKTEPTVAHYFTAQALTRCFIRRRRSTQTLEQTEPLHSDKLFFSLFVDKIHTSTEASSKRLQDLAAQLVDYNNYKEQPSNAAGTISPAIIHATQILGLARHDFNVPPFDATRASRALTKAIKRTLEQSNRA